MSSHVLFDDVLLETTSGERRRRKLTLFATIAGEGLAIAAIIAIPLLYLDAVPGYSAHAATIASGGRVYIAPDGLWQLRQASDLTGDDDRCERRDDELFGRDH